MAHTEILYMLNCPICTIQSSIPVKVFFPEISGTPNGHDMDLEIVKANQKCSCDIGE